MGSIASQREPQLDHQLVAVFGQHASQATGSSKTDGKKSQREQEGRDRATVGGTAY